MTVMTARLDLDDPRDENARLRARLEETEAVLAAIRAGEVDAFVVAEQQGESVYTLETADRPYRMMVEHMQEGAALVGRDSTVFYANARMAELLHQPLSAVIGARFEGFVEPGRRDDFCELLDQNRSARLELMLSGDGPAVPVMMAARQLPPDANSVCLIVTDLSDQQARRDLEREVEQRQRVERTLLEADRRKNEFLAMLGHELRNPLAAITGAVRLLDAAGQLDERAGRAREVIGRQAQHLARMVSDLLDVGRVTSGKLELAMQPLDLDDIVRRSLAGFQDAGRLAGHRIEVTAGPPLRVLGDPTRLEQVVGNLMANALRYTPEGGRVRISLSKESGQAALQVTDSGAGIPGDLLPHVFDLFVQGSRDPDRMNGGLGIGLTLVRRIVEMHGGSVAVSSEGEGHGSTFVVRLPLSVEALRDAGSAQAAHGPGRRVLLVEDHADSRDMLRLLLEANGHTVVEAHNGPEAVSMAMRAAPEIALVDLGLPGFDGYEVARRIRDLSPDRPIMLVALTGYGQPEHQQQALAAGFDAHLTKPVELDDLEGLFATVISSSRSQA